MKEEVGIRNKIYYLKRLDKNHRMNQQDIKNLEKELWDAADELRGNSKLTSIRYMDLIASSKP